jgi:hypothetical protein
MNQSSGNYGQHMVDQGPRFEGHRKKKPRRENQVLSKANIIRPDKRNKAKYL